ncbi:MAG: GIY-YIG nuclease family protein [Sulfuricellaceae bacterium]
MNWRCYILECADGTLYTGITNDLDKRLAAHNNGTASKYTRSRLPVRVVFFEAHPDRATASRRENAIKRMPRAAKLRLVVAQHV